MSTFSTPSDHAETEPLQRLSALTAQAWDDVLMALDQGDAVAARRVLRGDRLRRRAVQTAHAHVTNACARQRHAGRRQVSTTYAVHLVADLARINTLVVHLARWIVATHPRPHAEHVSVSSLRVLGHRRLEAFAATDPIAALDAELIGCGSALLELFEELVEHAHRETGADRGSSAGLCAALAGTLLEATRHAARVRTPRTLG